MSKGSLPTVGADVARRLLLDGQGLLDDPTRRAGPSAVQTIVEKLGFVQVDSIRKIERAHHLILGARLDNYRAKHLDEVLFKRRTLFEHWTHDAALIPTRYFPFWKRRFARTEQRLRKSRWFTHRLGAEPERTLAHVESRIAKEGPLRTGDFALKTAPAFPAFPPSMAVTRSADKPSTGWWDWTPEKAALEFLWHTGRLAIHGRDNFQKIYDLIERTFPEAHAAAIPDEDEHCEWACGEALERLGVATSGEIAAYWAALKPHEAAAWCRVAAKEGRIVEVLVESADGGKPRKAYAVPDWRKRARRLAADANRIRLLAPFDPLVRDRKRIARLFDFDFRFEAFVPAAKRKYGYYVCPLLEGDRLVGRIEPQFDRSRATLVVEKLWWERGVKATQQRRRSLNDALGVLAEQIGAEKIVWQKVKTR